MNTFTADTIIVGGGVMGFAAAYHLAKDGQRVLILEQFSIGNNQGSSHGASRLFRLVHNDSDYIELAKSAYTAWRELEAESAENLIQRVGGLDIGAPQDLQAFCTALQESHVSFEQLDRTEIMYRYPPFKLTEDVAGIYQEDYCLMAANRCVATLADQARRYGACFLEGQRVERIEAFEHSVEVSTSQSKFSAGNLILSAGSWMRPLARQLGLELPLTVTKEMVAYFKPKDHALFMPNHFPLFRQHLKSKTARWGVGFPIFNHTEVKMTLDCTGPIVDPGDSDRRVETSQLDLLRRYTAGILPELGDDIVEAETCRYTMTPDEDFILDYHPDHPQIVIASPCSGHGFKFAILIGRILADLAQRRPTTHPIERFRLERPALGKVF